MVQTADKSDVELIKKTFLELIAKIGMAGIQSNVKLSPDQREMCLAIARSAMRASLKKAKKGTWPTLPEHRFETSERHHDVR